MTHTGRLSSDDRQEMRKTGIGPKGCGEKWAHTSLPSLAVDPHRQALCLAWTHFLVNAIRSNSVNRPQCGESEVHRRTTRTFILSAPRPELSDSLRPGSLRMTAAVLCRVFQTQDTSSFLHHVSPSARPSTINHDMMWKDLIDEVTAVDAAGAAETDLRSPSPASNTTRAASVPAPSSSP